MGGKHVAVKSKQEEMQESFLLEAIEKTVVDLDNRMGDEAIDESHRTLLSEFRGCLLGVSLDYRRGEITTQQCCDAINTAVETLKKNFKESPIKESGMVWSFVRPILNALIRAVNATMSMLGLRQYSMGFYKKSGRGFFVKSTPIQDLTKESMIKAAIGSIDYILQKHSDISRLDQDYFSRCKSTLIEQMTLFERIPSQENISLGLIIGAVDALEKNLKKSSEGEQSLGLLAFEKSEPIRRLRLYLGTSNNISQSKKL